MVERYDSDRTVDVEFCAFEFHCYLPLRCDNYSVSLPQLSSGVVARQSSARRIEMEPVKKLDRSVKGRAVLVTGAVSGMGRATAHLFAQEGALVAITDINEAGVARVVEEIAAVGGTAHGWRLDVSDAAEIKRVVAEVTAHC